MTVTAGTEFAFGVCSFDAGAMAGLAVIEPGSCSRGILADEVADVLVGFVADISLRQIYLERFGKNQTAQSRGWHEKNCKHYMFMLTIFAIVESAPLSFSSRRENKHEDHFAVFDFEAKSGS